MKKEPTNKKKKKELSEELVRTLILEYGFLEGIYINIGLNPINKLAETIFNLLPQGLLSIGWFKVIMLFVGLAHLVFIYAYGGIIGLIALLLAFLAGIWINVGMLGGILLIISILLGLWGFSMKKKIKIQDVINFFKFIFRQFKK